MYKEINKESSSKNILSYLLYTFLILTTLNPLFSYYLRFNNFHTIILLLMFFTIFLYLLKGSKIKISKMHIYVYLYSCIAVVGVFIVDFDIVFAIQALLFRIVPPILFLMFFSLSKISLKENNIGYSVLKITNALCIILALFGLIEKINPSVIHKYYGNSLTTHMTLILNGNMVSRLISLAGNPINLGFYMAIGVGSAIVLIIINWKKSRLLVALEILCIPLFIYIMFLTFSRAAIFVTFVMILTIFILLIKNINIGYRIGLVFIMIIGYAMLSNTLFRFDALQTRISTISWKSFLDNTRFLRAYNAFDKDTHFFQYMFGHGIYKMNNSSAFVFELGYASLLYESGIIGLVAVIGSYLKGGLKGIKMAYKSHHVDKYVSIFYTAIIVSGLTGMLVEDLYMQKPFSVYLWFSTFFLLSKSTSVA